MNLKLLKKLIRRFAKLRAGEKLDVSDELTPQEERECKHIIERFHCYGDRSLFETLVALAIVDIYGSAGKLDIFIADLLRRIKQNTADKPSLQLVLGLLRTLPTDQKHLESLAALLHPGGINLSYHQQKQSTALHDYALMLGNQGDAFLAILEEALKTGVTACLIGQPIVADQKYDPALLLEWACELESKKAAQALLAARRHDPLLPRSLATFLSTLLSAKSYKAARFFLGLDLAHQLQFKTSSLSALLVSLMKKNRGEALDILLNAFPIIEVIPETGLTWPPCLLSLNILREQGYGQWNACEQLLKNVGIRTANNVPLFQIPDKVLSLLEQMQSKKLLQMEDFEQCSLVEQYQILKVIDDNQSMIYGPDPYDCLCQELKSYPALSQIFCKGNIFEGPFLLVRHAARTNNISCLSPISLEEIGIAIASNINYRTGRLLDDWPEDENIDFMTQSILFSAMVHGSIDFLMLVEARVACKGLSPLKALQAAILQRPAAKGWLVFTSFLTSSVGKPVIMFLLEQNFLAMTDLPPEIQAALISDMTPDDYALHFLAGEAAWLNSDLPVVHEFMMQSSRCGFKAPLYRQMCILSNAAAALAEEEIDEETLEQGFKLSILFGTPERAWAYIEKYAAKGERWPIHRLCQFDLPSKGFWQPEEWGDFALAHGLEAARWAVFAPYFEKAGLGVPQELEAALKFVVSGIYGVSEADPVKLQAFATLCASYRLAPEAFAICQGHIESGLKTSDILPDCFISGETIGVPGYYFMKLPCGDMRGFLLGKITNCCQYVGSEGGSCAISGMMDQNSGFYVVCKMAGTAPSPQDQIVAQLWAWIGDKGYLVFDSWERLRGENDWMCRRFLPALKDIVNPGPMSAIKGFYIGNGGNTPKSLCYVRTYILETHPDVDIYSDALKKQLIIYGREQSETEERNYLRKIANDFDLEEGSVFFLFNETYDRNEGWVNNIVYLLRSQRGVSNVVFTIHPTSQGFAKYLIKADIEDWIHLEITKNMTSDSEK